MALGAGTVRAVRPFAGRVIGFSMASAVAGAAAASFAVRMFVASPTTIPAAAIAAMGVALVLLAALVLAVVLAVRTASSSTPARLLATSLFVVASVAAAESPLRTFEVPIDGPASARIVPQQASEIESYPSLYVLDREFRVVAFAERWNAILELLGKEPPSSTDAATATNICEALRLAPADARGCRDAIAGSPRTWLLLTAEPCAPCARVLEAFEQHAADHPSSMHLAVVHRPAM